MALDIRWSATLPGDAHHLLAVDPNGALLYAGDGWGVTYASLSLRLIDMRDRRELNRVRTKYQQPRSMTYRGPDFLLATDSRVFELSRSDLTIRRSWERGIPWFADALELESEKLLMTNWLRPTAGILDLASGRSTRWPLEAGLRPLRRADPPHGLFPAPWSRADVDRPGRAPAPLNMLRPNNPLQSRRNQK